MIALEERETAHQLQLRSLLEVIVSGIARKTPTPEIEHYPDRALFTLSVDPHDQGRFIGKLGATIWAIQTLFWYAGLTLCGYSYSVKLMEPEDPILNRKPVPLKFNPKWDRKKIENLIANVLGSTLRSYASYSLSETSETSMTINLKVEKYLAITVADPNFVDAFSTVMRVAGMSSGVNIKTEAIFA